jgi:cytochrome c oxidase subunit 4
MVIATIKAGLVMAFFMHLAYDKPFNVIVFLSSFAFVALFLIFTMGDSKLTSVDFEPKVDDEASEVSEVAVVDTLEQVAATESEQATVEMEETVTE